MRLTVFQSGKGDCLLLALASSRQWEGRVIFDTPRHREHLRLPVNYPRLNEWPEWWSVEPAREYAVTYSDGAQREYGGGQLASGLPVSLAPGESTQLTVCSR